MGTAVTGCCVCLLQEKKDCHNPTCVGCKDVNMSMYRALPAFYQHACACACPSTSTHTWTCVCVYTDSTNLLPHCFVITCLPQHAPRLCLGLTCLDCRLAQLQKLGMVPSDRQPKTAAAGARLEPGAGLDLDRSEAASMGLGPLPPWPTPLQLRQSLADWGLRGISADDH